MNLFWVALLLVTVGIALPIMLAKSNALQKTAMKLPGANPDIRGPSRLTRVRCDCGADTICPQGRNVQKGDPYCCTIWKAE